MPTGAGAARGGGKGEASRKAPAHAARGWGRRLELLVGGAVSQQQATTETTNEGGDWAGCSVRRPPKRRQGVGLTFDFCLTD